MTARFGFFSVAAFVFGIGSFSQTSQAQCDYHYGGSHGGGGLLRFLGEVLSSHDHYHDDHYYEYHYEYEPRYHSHYGDSPDYGYHRPSRRVIRNRVASPRELIPPLPADRRLPERFKQYTPADPGLIEPRYIEPNPPVNPPRDFDKQPAQEAPTSTSDLPGYIPAEPAQTAPGMNTDSESVSPYLKPNPDVEQTPPAPQKETPKKTIDVPLPERAPRDLRNMDRIAPPDPIDAPEKVVPPLRKNDSDRPKSDNGSNSSSAAAATGNQFPIDMVIANSDDEFTTVREVIGENEAVLIDFWASWCQPCIDGMPELKRRAEVLADYGIAVAGMNVEGDIAKANHARTKYGMQSVAWLVEPESMPFSTKYRINSIPQVMLISREGDIIFQGYPNDPKLESALEALVAE